MSEKHPFDSSDEENAAPAAHKPEAEEEGMVVAPHCSCISCDHWTKSVDWCPTPKLQFENDPETSKPIEKLYQPLLRPENSPKKEHHVVTFRPEGLSKIAKETTFRILVQGEEIPDPVNRVRDSSFDADILKSLEDLNYKFTLPLQAFVWPAISKQMNVLMIGNGKTMSYLPGICTFSMPSNQNYNALAKHKGPLAIIICSTSSQCEEIFDLLKKLVNDLPLKSRPKVAILTYPISNIHTTDILITLPDSLVHSLKARVFNLKRLCHLVFEDLSNVLTTHNANIYKILEVVDEMLQHRPNNLPVQLIAASEKWTTDVKKLLQKMFKTPLVCIDNHLEAALYGNIQFDVKFLMAELKMAHLEGIIKDKYRMYKTLVICNQNEIREVSKGLARRNIDAMILTDESTKEDIEECAILWSYTPNGYNKVLVCTDFVFESFLRIDDIMWLIHYSFPTTWTRFSKRFSALLSHYSSPLVQNKDGIQCKSFIMIDETCEKQMPRILNLVKRLTKDLPSNYQKYADVSQRIIPF